MKKCPVLTLFALFLSASILNTAWAGEQTHFRLSCTPLGEVAMELRSGVDDSDILYFTTLKDYNPYGTSLMLYSRIGKQGEIYLKQGLTGYFLIGHVLDTGSFFEALKNIRQKCRMFSDQNSALEYIASVTVTPMNIDQAITKPYYCKYVGVLNQIVNGHAYTILRERRVTFTSNDDQISGTRYEHLGYAANFTTTAECEARLGGLR